MLNIFEGKGIIINGYIHLSPAEAYACCEAGAIIIDVREAFMSSIKTFHVSEIFILPLKQLSERINELPKDKYLIFADATGVKSKPAMEFAAESGFTHVANLAGGLLEWERDGLPVLSYQKVIVSGHNRCEFVPKK